MDASFVFSFEIFFLLKIIRVEHITLFWSRPTNCFSNFAPWNLSRFPGLMNIDVALNRIAHQKVSFFFNSFFFKKKIVSDTKIGFPAAAGWLRVKKNACTRVSVVWSIYSNWRVSLVFKTPSICCLFFPFGLMMDSHSCLIPADLQKTSWMHI